MKQGQGLGLDELNYVKLVTVFDQPMKTWDGAFVHSNAAKVYCSPIIYMFLALWYNHWIITPCKPWFGGFVHMKEQRSIAPQMFIMS